MNKEEIERIIANEIQNTIKVHGPTRRGVLAVLKRTRFKVGVEIGVQYGLNVENILDHTRLKKLYGVDPYDTSIYPISVLRGLDDEIYESALKRTERFGDRFEMIRKTANDAVFDIDGEIDFIYLDGGRHKKNIIDDVSLWYPKISKDGIMTGNGYGHSSHPWISRFLHTNFTHVNSGLGNFWWIYKNPLKNNNPISVVVPFYNAFGFAKGMLDLPLKDDRINEIVIVDDCSKKSEYEKLEALVKNEPKVRLYRNEKNLGEFKTRIRGAELAKHRWAIFLDNDNELLPEYLEAIENIPYWREDVIYCPDYGTHSKIDYRQLGACYIGKSNIKRFFGKYPYPMPMMLGTGNYFMNKAAYLGIARSIQNIEKHKYSDFYFNTHWLKKNMMYVVKGMHYLHRIRKDSAWIEYKHTIQPVVHQCKAELMGEKQCECKHCRRKRQ